MLFVAGLVTGLVSHITIGLITGLVSDLVDFDDLVSRLVGGVLVVVDNLCLKDLVVVMHIGTLVISH